MIIEYFSWEWLLFFIKILFLGINVYILLFDILYRRIPNIALFYLIALLPLWLWIFNGWKLSQLVLDSIISALIIWTWVFFHIKNRLIGAGDLKYSAILILYITGYPLSIYTQNIWVLTIICLLSWWIFILIRLGLLRKEIDKKWILPKIKNPWTKRSREWIFIFFIDWCLIGWIIAQSMGNIMAKAFSYIWGYWDSYFFIAIIIFLIRPIIRKMLFYWRYGIFPIMGLIIYLCEKIISLGLENFLIEWMYYIGNIWHYAAIFTITYFITKKTFDLYDKVTQKENTWKWIHTIPYSIILFLAFIVSYFWNIKLIDWIYRIFNASL